MKKNPLKMVITVNRAAIATGTPGTRSTRPGTSGVPPVTAARRSIRAKTATSGTLAAISTQPQAGQCSGWPSTSGSTNASTAGVSRARPGRSRVRPGSPRPCGRARVPATSSSTPTGTLTRKTGRQPEPNRSALTSRPPASWPTTAPPAITAAYKLMARARAGPVWVRWIRLSTCGIIMAAPAPWTKRSAMSSPAEAASPQPSEASVNSTRPDRNTRRWPAMSPSRAPVTRSTA